MAYAYTSGVDMDMECHECRDGIYKSTYVF